MHPQRIRYHLGSWVVLGVVALLPSVRPATAGTVAYWRFEDLADGERLYGVTGGSPFTTTADASGNGNHLRTWNYPPPPADTSPTATAAVPFDRVAQSGAANTRSLFFAPNQDIYTPGTMLDGYAFAQWTIEATVWMQDEWYRTIVGKDGPTSAPDQPPLRLWSWGHNAPDGHARRFAVTCVDAAGVAHTLDSAIQYATGTWYSLAAVNDGSTLSLYIKSPGDTEYVLQGSTPVSGAWFSSTATWTVGRGWINGGINDWWWGGIDEVRVSDVALRPSEFLGAAQAGTLILVR